MFFKLNPTTGQPLYLQLMQQIRHAAETGALQNGDQLPGIRTLAEELVVSPNTVAKAYSGSLRITGEPARWYDPAGFSLPAAGFLGNAPRNVLRAPGLFTQDIALRKDIRLGEKTKLEFRSELFNVFNHPNFAAPNNTRDPTGAGGRGDVVFADASGKPVGNAGTIFSTVTTSRQVQFALKLSF
jgi:hypothetical protein